MNDMGRIRAGLAALAAWQMVWFLVTVVDGQGLLRINTTLAKEHVGEVATVCNLHTQKLTANPGWVADRP